MATPGRADDGSATEDIVEGILGELEPIIARTREVLARVWHDRSISKANLHVLMLLEQFGPLPMSRLATMIDVSLPNMTGIIDRMEENGVVERLRDGSDRRVVLVRSTPKGASISAELAEARRDYFRRVVTALPREDRLACYAAFRAFRRASDSLTHDAGHEHGITPPAGPARERRHDRREDRGHPTTASQPEE
ncbi:MAG: MarR family transcriptional regulator, organic hydroperoxide resistance regulator [Chloroflexota bacterium]|jgi:DNA-binding MarR family transcriptional regulator|nr:MarR family transcriptional regulator, organic hydroperoxide resistance regulator [Chloroflexota bacterium]